MNDALSINFRLRSGCHALYEEKPCSIHAVIRYKGTSAWINTKLSIKRNLWDSQKQNVKNNSIHRSYINNQLAVIKSNIIDSVEILQDTDDGKITAKMIRDKYLGADLREETLIKMIEGINKVQKERIDVDRSLSTYKKYDLTLRRVKEFLSEKNLDDILLIYVDRQFVLDFQHFIQTRYHMSTNSVFKIMSILKRVLMKAYHRGNIKYNVFADIKLKKETKFKECLNTEELHRFLEYQAKDIESQTAKDFFVFCSYTGYDFSTASQLTTKNIRYEDNALWLKIKRVKTGVIEAVPVLEIVKEIIKKYTPDFESLKTEKKLLPEIEHNRYNVILKRIAKECNINKNITAHMARHTFASTVALSNGIPIDIISKVLGHRKLSTTQIYAQIDETTYLEEFNKLEERLTCFNIPYPRYINQQNSKNQVI